MNIEASEFAEQLELGWDSAIEWLGSKLNQQVVEQEPLWAEIRKYNQAYAVCNSADIDDGECGAKRQQAIQNIVQILENGNDTRTD